MLASEKPSASPKLFSERIISHHQAGGLHLYLENEICSEMNFEEIVGKSSALSSVLKHIETVAPTESTVLIYGETLPRSAPAHLSGLRAATSRA